MQLFLSFVVALSISAVVIPILVRWAPLVGLTDAPGPRKVHSAPVPRVGGIAMAVGIVATAVLTLELTAPLLGLLSGLFVLLGFGVWDDRANLGYRTKFLGQILAVVLCMSFGDVRIETITIGDRQPLPELVSWTLTFFFLIGVTNAVNLADGLDGLAGGMVLLCLCAIALFGAASGNAAVTGIALIEAGAILGFLRFNTHPARVFMGDGGSQVLGFTIGVLAILVTQAETSAVSAALPLLLIGMPIIDTLAVMIRRIRTGQSPFTSDRNHLHHRLLALGFAHAEAVVLIYLLQGGLFLAAYFLRFESDLLIVGAFGIFAGCVLGLLRLASFTGWRRVHVGTAQSGRWLQRLRAMAPADRLQRWTLIVMAVSLVAYAATVIAATRNVASDVGILCLGLLILLLALGTLRAQHSLQWFERAAAYVGVVLLVYLDQTSALKSDLVVSLSWTLLGITAVAAVMRFLLSPTRRFEITSLDVLVIFLALVVPNLPGSIQLPENLPVGVAKAALLLYVVEMLLTNNLQRLIPRAVLALFFATIAVRGLIVPGA